MVPALSSQRLLLAGTAHLGPSGGPGLSARWPLDTVIRSRIA